MKELANLIREYRYKIKDFSGVFGFYEFTGYSDLNSFISSAVNEIANLTENKLAAVFIATHKSSLDAVNKTEPVLKAILDETEKLKKVYKTLKIFENSNNNAHIYKNIIKKILQQIELFFIELENLLLKGKNGEIVLKIDFQNELKLLKNSNFSSPEFTASNKEQGLKYFIQNYYLNPIFVYIISFLGVFAATNFDTNHLIGIAVWALPAMVITYVIILILEEIFLF